MTTDAVEAAKPSSLSPSTDGAAGSDTKRRWDEQTRDSANGNSVDVVNYSEGVDVAVDLVAGAHADDVIDPEVAARIRRKIDWHILPLLFAIYTGAYARLLGVVN
jgi:hypothetical protein